MDRKIRKEIVFTQAEWQAIYSKIGKERFSDVIIRCLNTCYGLTIQHSDTRFKKKTVTKNS